MENRLVLHRLTDAQTLLLERHRRGLERVAVHLAARNRMRQNDLMFTVADRKGRIGQALKAALPAASIGPVVLPARAAELSAWLERLALHGPVLDLTGGGSSGIPVIVIDENDAMALCRISVASDQTPETAK